MRSSSLLEQIIEDSKKSPIKKDINRAAVLALRVEIKEALDQGWSMKKIWKVLHDRGSISFSYQAFTVYVNRLILCDDKQAKYPIRNSAKAAEKPVKKPDDKPQQVAPKEKVDTNIIKSFIYDPLLFTKEDLI
jgi:hypothetical protein